VVPAALPGQSRAAQLVDSARRAVTANRLDSAAALLRLALDSSAHATRGERENAFVWQGIVQFLAGDSSAARAAFRQALALDSTLDVKGLDRVAPVLGEMFQQEKRAAARQAFVYISGQVNEPPRRLSGPAVQYPSSLLGRHVQGMVEVSAIIDTAGRAEPASVEVLATPDSGLIAPVKHWMLASQFSPGRQKGVLVRVMVQLAVGVHPPRLAATDLVTRARAHLAAGRSDSALTLLDLALDTALTHPTDGERAYALLARGVVGRSRRDSAARADRRDGLALYQDLRARGIDLAPFLRRLADSVRTSGAKPKGPGADMPAPSAVGGVDEQPVLVFHPPIHYPPELAALKVDGIVMVEATLDAMGHIERASARLVGSPNHGFDAEALRVVRGSVYRPARSNGQPVRAVIRQAISFVTY
jgi:TonB family protein